jgi:glycosyltransferase involved in cell wall biosynthesis
MKKKLLIVLPSLTNGGAEHQTVKIINYLKDEYDISLLVFSNNLNLLSNVKLHTLNVFILKNSVNTFSFRNIFSRNFLKLISEIKNIMILNQFDIVLSNLPISHTVMRLVRFKIRFKLINIHHSLQFQAHRPHFIMKVFMRLNTYLANKYDNMNIFISEASRKDQLTLLKVPLEETIVINNGVTIVDKENIENIELDSDYFNIVMAARFVPEKNHSLVIDCLLDILDTNIINNIKIYFLGNGPLENKMIDRIKDSIYKDNFIFKGTVNHESVLGYFKSSDLVVIPSKSEGFGNIAVEAGLMGARILSSNAGGLNEIIKHEKNGFKFESENKEELKKELNEIINLNKEIDREKVVKIMEDNYSFKKMIEKYIEVIENV